jgi:hypothetical protein
MMGIRYNGQNLMCQQKDAPISKTIAALLHKALLEGSIMLRFWCTIDNPSYLLHFPPRL